MQSSETVFGSGAWTAFFTAQRSRATGRPLATQAPSAGPYSANVSIVSDSAAAGSPTNKWKKRSSCGANSEHAAASTVERFKTHVMYRSVLLIMRERADEIVYFEGRGDYARGG